MKHKNMGKIKNAILGGRLTRLANFLLERKIESRALNPIIPYTIKKSLAQLVVENERRIRDNLPEGLAVLRAFTRPVFVPVHLHQKEWNGEGYKIWEEKSMLDDDSNYTVFFPELRFPNFSQDISLMPEEGNNDSYNSNRARLDGIVEDSIWKNILYQSPVFRNTSRSKRPGLSDKWSFVRSVPYKEIPETARVPLFHTESIGDANAEARAIVKVYQRYKDPMKEIIELLKKDKDVRKEFLGKDGELATEQLLRKCGLDIDILPSVINIEETNHRSVPYAIYETKGGSFSGGNDRKYWGFINGIQFPDFDRESGLSEDERRASHGALALMFDYALYTESFFEPEGEGLMKCINHLTPQLVNNDIEEARIAEVNTIPGGRVVPFVSSSKVDYMREKIETTINAYNNHKDQISRMIEKLTDREIQKGLSRVLGGYDVCNLSYSVAEFLGEHGARFMIENEYHLQQRREFTKT